MNKILICEDDADLRNIIKIGLSHEFQVVEAENGKIGLEMIAEEKPDLVLLDILMPKMDGFALLKELRSKDSTKELPVIMLTNVAFDEGKLKALLDLNASSYILKSEMKMEEIISKIHQALNFPR